MRGMLLVHLLDGFYESVPACVLGCLSPFPPLVESGPADTQQETQLLNIIITAEKLNYFVVFSLKRMYSFSPAAFIRTV